MALEAENQRLREGQAGVQALATSVAELAQSLKKDGGKKILVDTKGLGKPEQFDNKEEAFRRWIRSVNNMVTGVFGTNYEKVLETCLDSENPLDLTDLETQFVDEVDDVAGVADQLFRVLCHLCAGESEDLVVGTGNGFEAYRRLCRRWDPATSGRKRNLLRAILTPERCKSWASSRT